MPSKPQTPKQVRFSRSNEERSKDEVDSSLKKSSRSIFIYQRWPHRANFSPRSALRQISRYDAENVDAENNDAENVNANNQVAEEDEDQITELVKITNRLSLNDTNDEQATEVGSSQGNGTEQSEAAPTPRQDKLQESIDRELTKYWMERAMAGERQRAERSCVTEPFDMLHQPWIAEWMAEKDDEDEDEEEDEDKDEEMGGV